LRARRVASRRFPPHLGPVRFYARTGKRILIKHMLTSKRTRAVAKILGGVLIALYLGVSWIDAEREVRILCGMFDPGTSLEEVVRTLETGSYLHYRTVSSGKAKTITASSYYNGLHTACTVDVADDRVTNRTYRTWAQRYVLFGE